MYLTLTFPLSPTKIGFNGAAYLLPGISKRIRIRGKTSSKLLQIIEHPSLKDVHLNVKVSDAFYQIDFPETYAMLYHKDKFYTPPIFNH